MYRDNPSPDEELDTWWDTHSRDVKRYVFLPISLGLAVHFVHGSLDIALGVSFAVVAANLLKDLAN